MDVLTDGGRNLATTPGSGVEVVGELGQSLAQAGLADRVQGSLERSGAGASLE